jgi:hypothetical protein
MEIVPRADRTFDEYAAFIARDIDAILGQEEQRLGDKSWSLFSLTCRTCAYGPSNRRAKKPRSLASG